jgi:hypothetical protein
MSSQECYRATLQGRSASGEPATLIVTRQGCGSGSRVWLTFDGAIATTLTMTDEQAARLTELLNEARGRVDERDDWSGHGAKG